ncbi:uncharacterized protein LOC117119338 [Anneissia japonica]|uniref:uncharacterized protein LOC117119338 n=1 Tax=Anneissia japonica TaxID=1529436 RepID=UPI001425B676|nr:uncharacterized protein LOC117119338 [Anneissia japonica]
MTTELVYSINTMEASSSTQVDGPTCTSRAWRKRRHTEDSGGQVKKKKVENVLSDKELCQLAGKIGDDWTALAFHLDFSKAEIEKMKADKTTINFAITCMLIDWRNRTEIPGIRSKLANHLTSIGRNDLAGEVIDMEESQTHGQRQHRVDLAYTSMLTDIEDGLNPTSLKKIKRLLRAPKTFEDGQSLTQYLEEKHGLRRTNVCILQSLLFYLKLKALSKIVEDFGRKNHYVVFLYEDKPMQGNGNTCVKFKLKCSPSQLSPDELSELLKEIREFLHMDVDCVVSAITEGCTCLNLDIPNEYIPAIRNAALAKSAALTDLGIFKVIINEEYLPDLCHYVEEEPQMMLLPVRNNEVSEQFYHLAEEFKDKWFEVGTKLKVPTNELQKIKKEQADDNKRAYEMLLAWRESWNKNADYSEMLEFAKSLYNNCQRCHSPYGACSSPGIHTCASPASSIVPPRGAVVKVALRNVLTAKYKELKHLDPNVGNPIPHSLEDNYIEIELKQKQDKRPLKLSAIVENGKEIRKVLIEGRTGYGKTTFCKKIVHDWATSSDVVFGNKIPLFVKVHEITLDQIIPACQGGILRQALFPRLVPLILGNLTHDEIWLFIQSNSSEFVFLIDGWEDASDELLEALIELLKGDYLPYSTIIVTSRSGNLGNDIHFDSHLILEGFSEVQIQECVNNTFKNKLGDGDLFLKEIKRANLIEFMECPLFAVLLSLMWQESSYRRIHGGLPSTWTDLLKHFCMFLIRRHERKEKGRKSGYFDTFHDIPPLYLNIMANIGKVASEALKKNSLMLQLSLEDGTVAESIGLIIKSSIVTPLKVIPSYVTIHRIMLEFLAAFYLKSISEPYPTELLMSKNMKMVTVFLVGLLNAEYKASALLKTFVDENIQNYELATGCLKECTNKQKVLKELGEIVSKHTYLDLGFMGTESGEVLKHLYSMLHRTKPLIMKIEASEVFFRDDHSSVMFARLLKCFPDLIAISLPRYMLPSQLCSFVNELTTGSNEQRCTSLEKISLVSDIESAECSMNVVQLLTLFPNLNELVLQVRMNTDASSKFLTEVTKRRNFLKKIKVLDFSHLTISGEKDCENMVTIFSQLPKLQRMIIPRRVLAYLYPRYHQYIPSGKYILHKMPVLPTVKISVFLQIDIDQCTDSPKSSIELFHNNLSIPDMHSETLSVPNLRPASPSMNTLYLKMSKSTVCDVIETAKGSLVLAYWNSTLGYERSLNQSEIMMLSPSAVYLHSFTSGNAKVVAELVSKMKPKEAILSDSSCASLATFYKASHTTMDGIVDADLRECSVVEKAAEAILAFPHLQTVHMTEKMNPVSFLQELNDFEMSLALNRIYLTLSLESTFDVLKSISIQFIEVKVSSCSITLTSPNFKGISIILGKDPTTLIHLPWVIMIQFEGDNLKFLKKMLLLVEESPNCFKNLTDLKFVEDVVDEKANKIMNDLRDLLIYSSDYKLQTIKPLRNQHGEKIKSRINSNTQIRKYLAIAHN